MTKGKKTKNPANRKETFNLSASQYARFLRAVDQNDTLLNPAEKEKGKSPFVRRAVMIMVREIEQVLGLPSIKEPKPRTKAKPKPKPEKAEHEDKPEEKKPITRFVIG